jgi:hypothetical protein
MSDFAHYNIVRILRKVFVKAGVSNFVGSPDRFTTERTENTEKTLLKISVSSVLSVVSK